MKRTLFLASSLAALSSPAFAQVQNMPRLQIDCGSDVYGALQAKDEQDGTMTHVRCYETNSAEVISVGERIGQTNIDQLTSASSILTASDVTYRGQTYVSDLLRSLPGIAVNTSGPASGLTQIRVRGSEANHVLVLIDGVEVSNPSAGEFDFSGLRAEDVERIEVLRGEQSALYGSDAIGGVINIITRAGETFPEWRASFEGGSFDTYEGQISAVIPIRDASLSVNGNVFTTDGYDISGLGGEEDGSKSKSLNVGLNNVAIGDVKFSAKFGASQLDVDFDGDTDFDGRLNNTFGETTVKSNSARVNAAFDLAGFEHLITASQSETDTDTRGGFSSRSVGKRQNINWAAKRDFDAHSFTALLEAEREEYSITPNFTEADAEPENTTYALAGDYRYSGDALTVTASARHDVNDLFDDATTWRVGAGYAFESFGGRLRASVGTGVKNPSMIELFGFFPASRFTGNRDLRPETSLGYSIGYEQELGEFNFSADYFRSELEDEITTVFNPDFTSTVINLGTDSTREGVELEARWTPSEKFWARAAATFLDSDQNGIEEIRRPGFTASVSATYAPFDALSLTGTIDHNGEQLDTDFGTFANVTLDSFTLVGLNAAYDVNKHLTVTLRGSNLLDEDYQEVVGYASQGPRYIRGPARSFLAPALRTQLKFQTQASPAL